ncbi:MAG: cytochrome c3 family protein [Proteobacteria bacterium]|nr:cytochrome c3 family protein [Pseudomonadota bacterium]
MNRLGVALVIVLGLGLLVSIRADDADGADGTAWSPVVYPLQRLPLVFSHAAHARRGTPCEACHATKDSRSAVDDLLPTEAACRVCHPIDRATTTTCAKCHPGYQPGTPIARVYLAPPPLKFSHAAHQQAPCARCHGDLAKVELATTKHLPTMTTCLACHQDGATERRCVDCHLAKLGGLIETRFPQGELVPHQTGLGDGHGPGFATGHRQEAMAVGSTCAACHDRSECVACHQGVTKPLEFHAGNYLLLHATEARRGTPDCSACHRAESFCVGCHERSGLGTRGDTRWNSVEPERRFHPASWAAKSFGAMQNTHAREAKRNVATCASCHREEDCLTCHTATIGALNASPHGAGWRGSARCNALDRGNRRMCLRCHVTRDEFGCDWSK